MKSKQYIRSELEDVTVTSQRAGVDRAYNVVIFRLRDLGSITLIDGDENDIELANFASGLVKSVKLL